MKAFLAILAVALSIWVLESARMGVSVDRFEVNGTPVMGFAMPEVDGPVVVVAHGFAGSSQMMQGYALPLARAGYRVYVFDFYGHGRHPIPMSGDVSSVEGTTRLLVEQTKEVIDAVSVSGEPVALLGHSMATDILVRVSAEHADVGPLILLSAFSQLIDATTPKTMLIVVGAWEPGLRDFALETVRLIDPGAVPGATVTNGQVTRRISVAPWTEHVSILHSRSARIETINWLDQIYQRSSAATIWPTGHAILGLLAGVVVLFGLLARRLPVADMNAPALSGRQALLVTLLPICATPPVAIALEPGILPVLVADYLALHLAIYGGIQLVLLHTWRVPQGPFSLLGFGFLMAGCILCSGILDRYVANFWPTFERLWIMAIIAAGSVLFFVADARVTHGMTFWRRLLVHAGFLFSLLFAVMLDFEGLFFLLMIAPVIVLFYVVFGSMGQAVSARVGPLSTGVALGLLLAWSLGVSFPLFEG